MMNSKVTQLGLQPADRIIVPKSLLNIVQHHAIYLGVDSTGRDLIAENQIGVGVHLVTAEDFFKKYLTITRVEKFAGSGYERKLAVQRALSLMNMPYSLINYNCESFSNHVQHNKPTSKQVAKGFAIATLAILFFASISRS